MKKKKKIIGSVIVISLGFLLLLNIIFALINPGYSSSLANRIDASIAYISGDRMIFDNDVNPASAQGGVQGINLQKAEEAVKKRAEETADKEDAAATAEKQKTEAAAKGGVEKKKKKAPPKIDPETLRKAMGYFNESLINRDVIQIGQSEKVTLGEKLIERPYISKSFRDNPFDEVQEVDINPVLSLKNTPDPPFYPPPGSSQISITGDEFKAYIETLKLQGVMVIGDRFYAIIRSGSKIHYKSPGDQYKEKFMVNVDDVTLDTVVISDEFGNKGLLEFDFRRGFQVQPVEGATFITNLG